MKLEVDGSRRRYLLNIMEHGWRLKSSLQSPEASKDALGTYAAYDIPRRLEPSIVRECQFEEFGIKHYSEIEAVLAELKCYISTERLQINGQNSVLFLGMLPSVKRLKWKGDVRLWETLGRPACLPPTSLNVEMSLIKPLCISYKYAWVQRMAVTSGDNFDT